MSEEGDGLPAVRVKFACANVEEFRRKFEANLLAKGMLARTPNMYEVGQRVTLRLELQDGSLGVDEVAVVQALEWTGGKQAMRLQLLRAKDSTAPAPVAAAPPAAPPWGPEVVALPPPRVPTGTAIPAANPDWATKAPERARTDTETTRAMSLDELLNALPPTAKPKLTPSGGVPRLTPSGGVPHLNGGPARPETPFAGGGFNPVPPAPPPPSATPLAPPIAEPPSAVATATPAPAPAPVQASAPLPQATTPPPQTVPRPTPMTPPVPIMAFPSPAAAAPAPTMPPLIEDELPPADRPMTPLYPMETPFASSPAPAPEAAPPAPLEPPVPAEQAPEPEPIPTLTAADFGYRPGQSSPASSNGELAKSIHESIQPDPADLAGPTAFNTATEATTASNATIAVPGLAGQVKAAKRRGPGGAIATFILFLAALSGAAAYLWRTGQLAQYVPELAARLPPSPASTAGQAPAPAEAPKATAEATPPAAEAPKSTAEATPPAAEAPKPTAEATPPAAEAPAPPAEAPKAVAAAEPPKPAEEPPKPPPESPKAPVVAAAETKPPPEAPKPAEEGPQVKIAITTEPPGAKVQANGEQVGAAPMDLQWTLGKPLKLRFSKPGFKPASRSFTPNANGTLDVPLTPVAAQADELKDVY